MFSTPLHPPLGADAAAGVRPEVARFIEAHRGHGHRFAALDPLGSAVPLDIQRLAPACFGLAPSDALTPDGRAWHGLQQVQALDERLKAAWCGALTLDASAVRDETRRDWLVQRMEAPRNAPAGAGLPLLDRLIEAQAWEHHVAEHHPEGKRFSLEGCEALLPLADALLAAAAGHGIADVFMGMPHRGRVNLLVNLLRMPVAEVLDHFQRQPRHPEAQTDLIYHRGGRRRLATRAGEVMLRLAPNPSHLQSVYPVVMGMAHACQRAGTPALAIVMHGDAAFAGQGVVMETLALTQKAGYSVGGTVHVVINNQVGFTELNLMDAQAARYCTDVTRMVDAPVLRVNADAPEDVLRAAAIAVDWRMRFGTDIVIDLIGYRRLGHSEHDAPKVTNPLGYALTEHKPSVVDLYGAALASDGPAGDAQMAARIAATRRAVREAFGQPAATGALQPVQAALPAAHEARPWGPGSVQAAVAALTRWPEGFVPHPVIEKLVQRWQAAADGRHPHADWCLAETLAYASVLQAGVDVRVSGLDVQRGTFMHRHAVWHDQAPQPGQPDTFVPLQQLGTAARFDIVNSVLSEEAVVGFEYGYSVQAWRSLTVWEGQFGDFVNGAQVYLDQYIAAGEEKWGQRSPLVLLLPHGYEGVGPEHSNAWLSRFLQLCGAGNLQVAMPSTAGQMFKLLRQQALAAEPRPLVVMTPKTTLHEEPASHTPLAALLEGGFAPVLADDGMAAKATARRVVISSGKLHYALQHARAAAGLDDVALLRLEQLYPFPAEALAQALARHPGVEAVVWAQEETLNQGAWSFVRDDLQAAMAAACPAGTPLHRVARPVTAAGATSSKLLHQQQEAVLVAQALGLAAA
ncbi:2-oxoglutarate dehydrogenase E1 component [Aquincola sp. J276]|uniref:2-oxoglutarate dehydrogenase E1 component n=1 Tax=Aquincola sp. J276 TaxID=2898432 RepID=UPI002151D3AB|nr:2-oxoglutarate dehydrogenase E1 component [Aquincola sp. J276]MCR5868906.1 2-oxoglutarate dehydrogenase E1 component [Aquincola sp. J276]